jgi:predicted transcriptional regulator
MAKRKRVVTSRIAGNDENLRGFSTYKEVKRIISETTIFSAIHTSRIAVGNGKIRIAKIPTIAAGTSRWLYLEDVGTVAKADVVIPYKPL